MSVWGIGHNYSKAIIQFITDIKVELVLDTPKAEYLVDLIVMATDRHHHSMRDTLAQVDDSQLEQLVKF